MRPAPTAAALLPAALALAALAGGARAGALASPGGGAIATAPPAAAGAPADERALAVAARAADAPPRPAARPVASAAPVVLAVASAPAAVFQDDETGRQIEAFVNGPGARAPGEAPQALAGAEPPRCDETPHGEVGAEYGVGGRHSQGGGGYGTVALPVANCHGLVVLSVSGDRFGRR